MELRLELIDAGRGVRMTTRGVVPGRLIVDAHRSMLERHLEQFAGCRYWFSDHSQLQALGIDADDTREVAALGRDLVRANPDLVIGALASGDLEYGILRMWQAHADDLDWRTRISRDENQLRAWMDEQLGTATAPRAAAVGAPVFLAGSDADCPGACDGGSRQELDSHPSTE